MNQSTMPGEPPRARFRRTLSRVLFVQILTLMLLGLLQILYS